MHRDMITTYLERLFHEGFDDPCLADDEGIHHLPGTPPLFARVDGGSYRPWFVSVWSVAEVGEPRQVAQIRDRLHDDQPLVVAVPTPDHDLLVKADLPAEGLNYDSLGSVIREVRRATQEAQRLAADVAQPALPGVGGYL